MKIPISNYLQSYNIGKDQNTTGNKTFIRSLW